MNIVLKEHELENGTLLISLKGTVDLQECLPENRLYEHRLR